MSSLARRNMTIPSPIVQEQVLAHLASVQMANVMKAMFNVGAFACVKTATPPIATGMTDTMKKLKDIITAQYALSPEEYAQVSSYYPR